MMVRCYWCISILIIIPTIRCCSLTGPFCGWSAVVLSDRRYPSFWNFDSAISIDVIRMKAYRDNLFDPTCVPVRVTINKLNFFPNRKMPRFVSVFRNCEGLRTSKLYMCRVLLFCLASLSLFQRGIFLFVLPWKSRKITLSPFSTRQFQGIQTVFSPPLFTESPPTLTNT